MSAGRAAPARAEVGERALSWIDVARSAFHARAGQAAPDGRSGSPTSLPDVARRGAIVLAVVLALIWALTPHDSFWVAWTWFGLACPFALDGSVRLGRRDPVRVGRAVSLTWSLSAFAVAVLLVVWALSGAGSFWPLYPVASLIAVSLLLAWLMLADRVPLSRRALLGRVEALARSRRQTVDAQAAELRRIERDLHDGAQARLVALSMSLGRAELRLADEPEARELVADAQREARQAIAELRDLTRGIAPPLLADRGLAAAVRGLAARYQADVEVDEDLERAGRLQPAIEGAAYFVVAEAMANAAKHAAARRIDVSLGLRDGSLVVCVADDGRGGARLSGTGIQGLEMRVRALDGVLSLESPPGAGTRLRVSLPCGS